MQPQSAAGAPSTLISHAAGMEENLIKLITFEFASYSAYIDMIHIFPSWEDLFWAIHFEHNIGEKCGKCRRHDLTKNLAVTCDDKL